MKLPNVCALILAAGQGTRMRSNRPKVLHPVLGEPILHHVVRTVLEAGVSDVVVVVGHQAAQVEESLQKAFRHSVRTVLQETQRGTGDAVSAGLKEVSEQTTHVLILPGDTPLLRSEDIKKLIASLPSSEVAMLSAITSNPLGYGRILHNESGRVMGICEERDCTEQQRSIREINGGVYIFAHGFLRTHLASLSCANAQGELYLTDLIAIAAAQGNVEVHCIAFTSLFGINDRQQLAEAEFLFAQRQREFWRRNGVTLADDVLIEPSVQLAPDVELAKSVVLRGATAIGCGSKVDVGCVIENSLLGENVVVKPYTVISDSKVADEAVLGPFAHLRPGSDIRTQAHIGNFVETKKTIVHRRAKANHLSYLGDGEIGEDANLGAGTIFCNYDGFQKHRTVIGARSFIGSDSQLVAPITIGEDAYIATGTTVTENVPSGALAIGRVRQENKPTYAEKLRARFRKR